MDDIKKVLEQRGTNYGDFRTQGAISQSFKEVLREVLEDRDILDSYQKEAIEMILHKISRIINGNPKYKDSWVDIAGYATLVADTLKDEPFIYEKGNE